jgi:NAD(P)-dependent dehydrogenase (short-subunit alcohol dehydrogenase family)
MFLFMGNAGNWPQRQSIFTNRDDKVLPARLPGLIWSRMWTRTGGIVDQLVQQYGLNRDESVKRFLEDRQMPIGIGQPEDVAHAVVFLASPRASFISGAPLDIGGTIRGLI